MSHQCYKYLKRGCNGEGSRFFPVVHSGRVRGNGHKHKRFHLNSRKHLFNVRVPEHWHRLLRGVVESQSLEIFRSHLDPVLGNHLQVSLLEQGSWTR